MTPCKNIFLSLICLIAITIKTQAQQKCTECPDLEKKSLLCNGPRCAKVIANCSWGADNPLYKGILTLGATPTIISPPLPGSSVTTGCEYKIKEDTKKTIKFTQQNK